MLNWFELKLEFIDIEIHSNTFKLKEEIPFITPENERVKSQIP